MTNFNTKLILALLILTSMSLFSYEKVAYHVEIETSNKGKMTVAVPQLESGEYQINSIFVKTKVRQDVTGNRFSSDLINSSLNGINVQSVSSLASPNSIKTKGTAVERIYQVEYEVGVDSYDFARELMKNPDIEYAVPVFNRYFTDFTPNDPELSKQWYIGNQQAAKVWDVTKGSTEVVIGIVDSGTDWQHPDLIDNIYFNPDEIPNNGVDDDNNGYIDDVNGWDFVGNVTVQQAVSGQYFPDNNPKPTTTANDHGTHVAGCASAATNNSTGIASLGFNTKLLVVKCGSDNVDRNTGGTEGIFRNYQGMIYAAENGADIINCSWGGKGFNPVAQETINTITEMGVLIVVSAGNKIENIDEELFYPAAYNNVLCVGSYASNNRVSNFSNYGVRTDIFAPGTSIYSTLPGNSYGNKQGTSMAGPIAAGLAALVKALHPDWTPHQLMAQLRSTTVPLSNVSDENKPLFFGGINSLKAVTSNANNFSSNKVKGMAFSETAFAANSNLDSYEYENINLKLVNYLAPVSGVKIEFIAMDKFIDIETDEVIVNGLETMDTSDVALRIKLNSLNPWFDGFARVLIKYTAEDYTDYQLLKVPIEVNTRNSFSLNSRIPEEAYAAINDVHTPTPGVVWAVGFSTYFNNGYVYNNTAGRIFSAYNESLTGVSAKSSSEAYVTTGTGKLLYTTNAGLQWTEEDFSDVTQYFNGIYVFNENNAVAFGDPQGGQFGVVNTTTGGNSWKKVSTVSSITGENGLVGSHCMFGDRMWFGTTSGRVIRGLNFGNNWFASTVEAGSTVIDVAFESNLKGIAIYSNRNKYGDAILMARTNDGGINWTLGVVNFKEDLGVYPVELIYNDVSEKIYVVCEKGEVLTTENLGNTWETVLSRQGENYSRADISNNFEDFVLYGASSESVTTLSFTSIPAGAVATLTSVLGDDYKYDSTEINKIKNNRFDFKNDGDLTIVIDSAYFTGADKNDFSYFGNPPSEIIRGDSKNMLVAFRPKEAREYNAQLVIVSNNEKGDMVINLTGKGYEPVQSSVAFVEFDKSLTMYPIPANNTLNLDIDYSHKISTIKVLDLSGKLINKVENITNRLALDISNINSGVYLVQFVTDKGTFYKKFIKE